MQLNQAVFNAFKSCTIEPSGDNWILKTGQMPRKDYEQFKKIVNAMRGEWKSKLGVHIFGHDPSTEIALMVESGKAPSYVENPFSFFPTPHEEVEDCVRVLARLQDRIAIRVAETGAGDGRFIKEILKVCPTADVRYWEIDERNRELLAPLNAVCEGVDFLANDGSLNGTFDYVLMNPEFSGKAYQAHIRKAFDLLKSGGELISIMPAMAIADRKFRDWMFKGGEASWYPGEYEFVGTKVKYVTVHMKKVHEIPAPCGYLSWDVYHAALALHSDARFWKAIEGCSTVERLSRHIEDAIDRIVRFEQAALCLDDDTLEALVLEFGEEVGLLRSSSQPIPAPVQRELVFA